MNKFEERIYQYIYFSDLQKLIKQYLNIEYNIPYELELNNGSWYTCITTKLHIDEIPTDLDILMLDELLGYMCTLGYVPEGNILVDVWW